MAFVVSAGAASAQTPDTLPAYTLEGLVVSVTRAPALRTDLPQRVDVVTRTDLERSGAADLAAILKRQAALAVIEYPGLLSGVGIRGFRPQISGLEQRTLLLIDGRPAGITNLSLVDPHSLERVEVLKGPASALYGSNAMGGAVNLVTRRSTGPMHASSSVAYGSWDTREANFAAGGSVGSALDFDLALSTWKRNEDYRIGDGNVFRDLLGDGTVVRTFADDSTAVAADLGDGQLRSFTEYGTRSGSLRLGAELNDGWRMDASANRFEADDVQNPGDIFFDAAQRSLKNVERTTGDIAVSAQLANHAPTLRVFASREESEFYDQPEGENFVSFRTPTRWWGVQLQDVIREGPHSLIYGVDYTLARAESERFSAPDERAAPFSPDAETRSRAAFAELRFATPDERWSGTLAGRFDQLRFEVRETPLLTGFTANEESHTVFNPSAGLQYATPGGVRVHGTLGRAFVAPEAFNVAGFAERAAGPGAVALTRGNPELEPEHSWTWDAGVGLSRPRAGVDADLTYFHTDVEDRITTRRSLPETTTLTESGDTVLSVTTFENADRAEIRGLEGRLGWDVAAGRGYALRFFGNATRILRAEEITVAAGGDLEEPILNVADLTVGAGAEYDDLHRWSARLSGRYVGERTDTDFTDFSNLADVVYPEFITLDAFAQLRFAEHYRVALLVGNLTDENYYEVRGYPLPGRSLTVRLGADF